VQGTLPSSIFFRFVAGEVGSWLAPTFAQGAHLATVAQRWPGSPLFLAPSVRPHRSSLARLWLQAGLASPLAKSCFFA